MQVKINGKTIDCQQRGLLGCIANVSLLIVLVPPGLFCPTMSWYRRGITCIYSETLDKPWFLYIGLVFFLLNQRLYAKPRHPRGTHLSILDLESSADDVACQIETAVEVDILSRR